MVHSERIVVVGGNAAGLSAASYVKRKRPEIEALIFSEISSRLIWLLRTAYYIEGLVKDPLELIAVPINALKGKKGTRCKSIARSYRYGYRYLLLSNFFITPYKEVTMW